MLDRFLNNYFSCFQTGGLRQKLIELERDCKILKLSEKDFVEQKLEILAALKRLDEEWSTEEKSFFENHSTNSMKIFVQVKEGSTIQDGAKILSMAKNN